MRYLRVVALHGDRYTAQTRTLQTSVLLPRAVERQSCLCKTYVDDRDGSEKSAIRCVEFVHSPLKYIGLSENSATPTIIVFPIKIAMFSSSAALRTPHFSQSTGKPNSNHVIHLYKSWKNQRNVGEIWNFYGFSMVSPHC